MIGNTGREGSARVHGAPYEENVVSLFLHVTDAELVACEIYDSGVLWQGIASTMMPS